MKRCSPMRWAALPAVLLSLPRSAPAQIAVVVHPSQATSDLSFEDLKRVYLGQMTTLDGRAVAPATVKSLEEDFYAAVLGMTPDLVQRQWMAKVFRGEDVSPPRQFANADLLRRWVAENPGAIGFLRVRDADATVKVLKIDGLAPSAAGYRIRGKGGAP